MKKKISRMGLVFIVLLCEHATREDVEVAKKCLKRMQKIARKSY